MIDCGVGGRGGVAVRDGTGGGSRVPHLLVADPDRSFGLMLSVLLGRRGWRVDHAETAAAALELVELRRPTLILTELDGFEVDGRVLLSRLFRWPDVGMIVHTRRPFELRPALCWLLGIWRVLARPCRMEAVLAAIDTTMQAATTST